MSRMLTQVDTGRRFALVSPAMVYQRLVEALFGTGIPGFRSMFDQLAAYRETLKQFLVEKDREDTGSYHLPALADEGIFSQKPADFNSLTKFERRELSLGESLKAAGWDLSILFSLNLLLFASVFVLFLRSDVRQH